MQMTLNFLLGICWGVCITTITFRIYNNITPSAIDVYRGRTTLEIIYKNDVPIDSIVVFKD